MISPYYPAVTTVRPPLPSLTGMRFIAASMVVFTHVMLRLTPDRYVEGKGLGMFWQMTGNVGVSFFFILSGFVLTWAVRPGLARSAFWRKRICKIYPNHLVTALLVVVLMLGSGQAVELKTLIPNLLLIQSWFPDLHITFGINAVSWSLACEVLFYLAFPLLYFWISRIPVERLWVSAIAVTAAIWSIPVIADLLMSDTPPPAPGMGYSALQYWFTFAFPPTRCLEFVLGIMVARIVISGRWVKIGFLPTLAVFLVFGAGALYAPGIYVAAPATMVIPLALVIPMGAVADLRQTSTFLNGRVMVWLGEVSFALYMVHLLVIMAGAELFRFSQTEDAPLYVALLMVVPFMVLSVGTAWLLYRFVELPVMRKWSRARIIRPAVPVPTDVK
ncbi:acyltransferase family protein [Nocardia iowensis]|uniref:Acyltransferase n=1 Tax=Nocardia iowensis TaxID=204891 RepID=A0ABX8RL90_NOCIO|nr:acyltransferase [Nocardia iowensis]QXN90086.1 acyltransferase [Nocardia iowensis]